MTPCSMLWYYTIGNKRCSAVRCSQFAVCGIPGLVNRCGLWMSYGFANTIFNNDNMSKMSTDQTGGPGSGVLIVRLGSFIFTIHINRLIPLGLDSLLGDKILEIRARYYFLVWFVFVVLSYPVRWHFTCLTLIRLRLFWVFLVSQSETT